VSKGNALTADTALSHFYTSKNPALASVFLYIFCFYTNQQMILYHNELKKASPFLKKIKFFRKILRDNLIMSFLVF